MDVQEKLTILADAAKYDASCASSGSQRKNMGGIGNSAGNGICHSYTPDGRCVSLLKILLTNFCIYDCSYCINRISSDVKRAKFAIQEVVDLTLNFYRRNYIEGLFLSSGIYQSPDRTMEELIEIARRLRVDHNFNGYIHLKAVAGASQELIQKAGLWADRLSANMELPTQSDLDTLAPAKSIEQVRTTMSQISDKVTEAKEESKISHLAPQFARAGQSTQLIVGATPAQDATFLKMASELYQTYGLRRIYYTAYSPILNSDPRLPSFGPSLMREHRLYQSDWLLRFYGFQHQEITPAEAPNLDLNLDPKLAWAIRNRHFFPVNVNTAPEKTLLRVPGFGMRTVKNILKLRRVRKVRLTDLARLRVKLENAKYFIVTADVNSSASLLDIEDFKKLFLPKPRLQTLFDEPEPQAQADSELASDILETSLTSEALSSALSGEM